MNLTQIFKKLKKYAITLPYVNEANEGDIYEYLNGNTTVKYSCINIDINQSTRNNNMINYSVFLYYVDRLTEDKSNWKEIKTTAEQALNSIVNYAAKDLGDVEDGFTINYFEQQFSDYCAGAWVNFILEVPNEMGDCLIDDYTEEVLLVTSNGTFDVTNYSKIIVNVPSVTTQEISQEDYDALTEYDPNKIYLIQD